MLANACTRNRPTGCGVHGLCLLKCSSYNENEICLPCWRHLDFYHHLRAACWKRITCTEMIAEASCALPENTSSKGVQRWIVTRKRFAVKNWQSIASVLDIGVKTAANTGEKITTCCQSRLICSSHKLFNLINVQKYNGWWQQQNSGNCG